MMPLTRAQLFHRWRWLSQRVNTPTVGVIGGYHGGNLGDIALGTVCTRYLRRQGISAGMQTIYSLPKWPTCAFALLGGGAIGYRTPLQHVRGKYGHIPERVAFLGVDFNDDAAICEHADFLRRAAMITCRSQSQAVQLRQLIDRSDIDYHADLAFALPSLAPRASARREGSKVLGVNCTTFFWVPSGQGFTPGSAWEAEVRIRSPHLLPWLSELGPRYVDAFRTVLERARSDGWQIWHVPFSSTDDRFARHWFSTSIDRFVPYSPNPLRVLNVFQHFTRFLPTRFHSLVFALVTAKLVMPFCYAEKSEQLCKDMGLGEEHRVTAFDLVTDPGKLARAWESPYRLSDEAISSAARSVFAALKQTREAISVFAKTDDCPERI